MTGSKALATTATPSPLHTHTHTHTHIHQVLGMIKNPHYLYRMTMLLTVSMLATIVSHDVLVGNMLPVILGAAKDKVGACSRIAGVIVCV